MKVEQILETCVYADDLEQAERFYRDVLGLELHSKQVGRHVFFRCGAQMFLVFNADATRGQFAEQPLHGCRGEGHVAFAVANREIQDWKNRLKRHDVELEHECIWPGGGTSIFIRDPAGNSVELASPRIWNLAEQPFFDRLAAPEEKRL